MESQYITDSTPKTEMTASRFPINRTYTKEQSITENDYVFHSPSDWFSSRSPGKCIGLRSAKFVPWRGLVSIPVYIKDEEHFVEVNGSLSERADIYDFIRLLDATVQRYLKEHLPGYLCLTSYDNGEFRMKVVDDEGDFVQFGIFFAIYGDLEEEYTNNFLAALNQPKSFDKSVFNEWVYTLEFNNVWDRRNLYIHSSISTDYNQILCQNNSSYDNPRNYLFPCSQPTFKIWFTTDTKNIILINSGLLVLKLCFIFNYKNAVM